MPGWSLNVFLFGMAVGGPLWGPSHALHNGQSVAAANGLCKHTIKAKCHSGIQQGKICAICCAL